MNPSSGSQGRYCRGCHRRIEDDLGWLVETNMVHIALDGTVTRYVGVALWCDQCV